MLKDKVAVVYGAGGAVGGAVARVLAREGAVVHLAGRTEASLVSVAADIGKRGGRARYAAVDARDQRSVEDHLDEVVRSSGRLDITLNAIGVPHVQGVALSELTIKQFEEPLHAYLRSNLLTAKAAARRMRGTGGVILSLSTPGSRLPGVGHLGYGVTCAAIEGLSRILAGEVAEFGIRTVCLRANAVPESMSTSHVGEIFDGVARSHGVAREEMLTGMAEQISVMKKLPSLQEIAEVAAFMASDRASAVTGAIVNVNHGALVD